MNRVALVTGGSSGIGSAAAAALAAAGCRVYELSRHGADTDGVSHITADVTDAVAVAAAVGEVLRREGRLEILVNNAGMGISGAVEFTDPAEARRLWEVNFMGTVHTIQAALPALRASHGRIVNISSVAAPVAIPFQGFYSASKAAVSALSAALAGEVAPFGVTVTTVLPGDIRTGFTAARAKLHAGDDVYGGRIGRSVAVMERDELAGASPEKAGAAICRIALKKRVRPAYTLGLQYQAVVALARLLPAWLVQRVVARIYAR